MFSGPQGKIHPMTVCPRAGWTLETRAVGRSVELLSIEHCAHQILSTMKGAWWALVSWWFEISFFAMFFGALGRLPPPREDQQQPVEPGSQFILTALVLGLSFECAWKEYANYCCVVSSLTREPETEIKFGELLSGFDLVLWGWSTPRVCGRWVLSEFLKGE